MDYYQPNARELERDLNELRTRLIGAAAFVVFVTLVGVVGFSVIDPDAGIVKSFFMTAITLTTVGYEEAVRLDTAGAQIFAALLILVGMGAVLYFVSTGTAFLLEGQLGHVFRRRRMERNLEALSDHHIVCGSGTTAIYAASELLSVDRDVVIIVETPEQAEFVRSELPDIPMVMGDATEDDVLQAAGIDRAKGLIACTNSDNESVVVTLAARQLNPGLRIVARVKDVSHESKVKKVGANASVSPQHIGGVRLASEMIRPTVVNFLESVVRDRDLNLRIEEVSVPAESPMIGKALRDIGLEHTPNLLLMAILENGRWHHNPPRSHQVQRGTVLICVGSPSDLETLRDAVA